jgi:hypothetical protein
MIDVEGGPDLDGGWWGLPRPGPCSLGGERAQLILEAVESLINRQLINGAALVGRPCFFSPGRRSATASSTE